jgi:hypothetical protein
MINHPLLESLRTKLEIPYNFYIEGFQDLKDLLNARGFKELDAAPWESFSEWGKSANKKEITLTISNLLFDEDKKLKFLKRTDWKDEYVKIKEKEDAVDELPF